MNFTAELIGTALLILLGNGVVAGVVLKESKSAESGWIVITLGWGLAVGFAVYAVGGISGAHLNPAVTLALAAVGNLPWSQAPEYLFAQILGAFIGACLVYLHYLPHWRRTPDANAKFAAFCTAPALRHTLSNCISEFLGTFVLLFGIMALGANHFAEGLKPLAVGALVLAIGLSLGGTTGYAINPARDLGPRLAHALLPVPGKRDSDWAYAWIPVLAPIAGGICGALTYKMLLV
ncbi:MAG: aquaporin family protein [Bacteroidetes bacterium]|nr:aquaporin family protein [Bacteroidota bacterium]